MVPGRFPAKVMVAPNSPSARAQVRAAPAISPGATIGSVTVRNTRTGEAPSEAAVSSYRGRSPPSAPSSEMTRNGIATNVAASTAPEVWKGNVTPKVSSSHGPSSPRRPNASRRATPPTVGGRTIGSSTSERTNALPGKGTRASSQASGTPSSRESPSAHRETSSESRSASVVASAVRWSPSSSQEVRTRMPTSGSIRNATASRAGTVSSRGARAPAVRRPGRLIGVTSSGSECGAVRCPAGPSDGTGLPGGTGLRAGAGYGCWKPAPWRIFCAAGVESQATNAAAASLCSDVFRVAAG